MVRDDENWPLTHMWPEIESDTSRDFMVVEGVCHDCVEEAWRSVEEVREECKDSVMMGVRGVPSVSTPF